MGISVVVVTESPELQRVLRATTCRGRPIRPVRGARSAAEGQVLLDLHPTDVLVLDLSRSIEDGLALVRYVAQAHPRTGVLVLIDAAGDQRLWATIEAGAHGCLQWPVSADELCNGIRDVQAGGSPISPALARCLLRQLRERLQAAVSPVLEQVPTVAGLTQRESEVLALMARGLSFDDMGKALFVSTHTVVAHAKHIYRKLAAHSRSEAVHKAHQTHLL